MKYVLSGVFLLIALIVGTILSVLLLVGLLLFSAVPSGDPGGGGGFTGGTISETGTAEIPPEFLPVYQAAAEQYGVPWNLLAAIHRVETRFSSIDIMVSGVGAEGHLQFMPCTWTGWAHPSCGGLGLGNISASDKVSPSVIARYGGYGIDGNKDGKADPWDITDAIYSAANYLAESGAADGNYEKAVFTYNHSQKYVSDVLGFMNSYASGGSVELVQGTGGFSRPLNNPVTSPFEMRFHPVLKYWRQHAGIDFDCSAGEAIPASRSGTVTYAGWQNINNPKEGLGIYVWVDHGNGFKSSYGHMSSTAVSVGQQIQTGQVVGSCGTTGTSTGTHLHFEIFKGNKQVDPAPYLGL